jgi:hypothetical protein
MIRFYLLKEQKNLFSSYIEDISNVSKLIQLRYHLAIINWS